MSLKRYMSDMLLLTLHKAETKLMAPDMAKDFHITSRHLSGTAVRKDCHSSLNTTLGPAMEKRVEDRALN